MLEFVLPIAFVMITIALILNLYRMIIGPTVMDRILALDTLYINAIALLILFSLYLGNTLYFEVCVNYSSYGICWNRST